VSSTPSRCTSDCGGDPYEWEYYRTARERVVENEIDTLLPDGCKTQAELDLRLAAVDDLLERASEGVLEIRAREDGQEITPVRTHPDVWELRWDFGRPFRLYHGEPPTRPRMLLALLAHWKDLNGTQLEIDAAQQAKMDEAAARFACWLRPLDKPQ
jgi:hypothetical protein